MPCKCYCFGKKQKDTNEVNDKLERDRMEAVKKKEQIEENYRILREDLYEGIMKKYFATGQDYR